MLCTHEFTLRRQALKPGSNRTSRTWCKACTVFSFHCSPSREQQAGPRVPFAFVCNRLVRRKVHIVAWVVVREHAWHKGNGRVTKHCSLHSIYSLCVQCSSTRGSSHLKNGSNAASFRRLENGMNNQSESFSCIHKITSDASYASHRGSNKLH